MMYKRAAALLTLGIILAGVFTGCKTPPPPPEPAPAPRREPAPVREARPAPPPPPEIPSRPITRDILELINKSAYELKDLQYFISSGITLEHGKGMQIDIEINPGGEGIIQEINAQEKIIIPKDTGGILIPDAVPDVPGGPRVLKICFDDMDEHTLMFRENPSDNRFYLMFREDPRYGEFTEYGNETYKVSFSGAIPYVYIKLDARTDDRPRTRELRGRYLSSRETGTEAPAETPTEEPPTPASVPSASQTPVAPAASRTPPRAPPVTPAPAASPTPTTSATTNTEPEGDDSEDEGLNLDELLGL